MSATDFEYAIKKDVRNNPIVREIDEARQQQLLRAVGIGARLVAVLLFSAWQHFELLQHGYLMERLEQERATQPQTVTVSPIWAGRSSPQRWVRMAVAEVEFIAAVLPGG